MVEKCEGCDRPVNECQCFNEETQPKTAMEKQVGGNHYKDKKLQPWDIVDALDLNFYEGNAIKYLIRYKDKNGVEDLKKAIHYIERIIENESTTSSRD